MSKELLEHRMDFLIHVPKNEILRYLRVTFGRLPYYNQMLLQEYLKENDLQKIGNDLVLSKRAVENLLWFSEVTLIEGLSEIQNYNTSWTQDVTETREYYIQCLTDVARTYEEMDLPDLDNPDFELNTPQAFEQFTVSALLRLVNHPSWRSIIYNGNDSDQLKRSFNDAVAVEFRLSQKERQSEILLGLARLADQSHIDPEITCNSDLLESTYTQNKIEKDRKFIQKLLRSRASLDERELFKIDSEIVEVIWDELMKAPEFSKLESDLTATKEALKGSNSLCDQFLSLYEMERNILLCGAAIKGMGLASRIQFVAGYDNWPFIRRLTEYAGDIGNKTPY